MRRRSWLARAARAARPIVLAAVPAALLFGCGRTAPVQVQAAPPPPAAHPASVFQGQVAAVDVGVGELVVAVHIVWAPVVQAADEERRVVVGPQTRWPAGVGLASLHVGEEVQVEAEAAPDPDGGWRAVEVQLFDVD